MKAKTCCIVANFNGHGLSRDALIIETMLLEVGFEVVRKRRRDRRPWSVFRKCNQYDLLIFLETIYLRWLFAGHKVVLIPNQEWFKPKKLLYLVFLDHIWCKSGYAATIFKKYAPKNVKVSFMGFTSLEESAAAPNEPCSKEKDLLRYERYLHVAGGSQSKGTSSIIQAWSKYKDLPHLTIVQRAGNAPNALPANVTLITDYLSDEEMVVLRGLCGVHLCPSESEGFGHNLFQGMLASAVVVTIDFPPMNELIHKSFGVLVSPNAVKPRRLGHSCFYEVDQLMTRIQSIRELDHVTLKTMGDHAKSRAVDLDAEFRRRFCRLLSSLND